jgi:alpha-tubulin suppressor-like RCC1 family protein
MRNITDRIFVFALGIIFLLGDAAYAAVTPKIAAGGDTSCAIDNSGRLDCWGSDDGGKLGQGRSLQSVTPLRVGNGFMQPAQSGRAVISAGLNHTVALKADGSLWAWGKNDSGQLGDGSLTDTAIPKQIGTGYAAVKVGASHTVALKTDGSVWAWGLNSDGQLGDGTYTDSLVPKQIGTGYTAIGAGAYHSLALKSDNSLWAWGYNGDGQLGDGTRTSSVSPKLIGTGYTVIGAGAEHNLALKSGGSLWAWGSNADGQAGDGTTTDVLLPKQIGSGYSTIVGGLYHSLALKSDGSLWAWGYNGLGQLGDGTTTEVRVPKQIGTGYTAIAAGGYHSLAIKSGGSLWAWGYNGNGQLGDGTTTNVRAPKQIGSGYAAVTAGVNYTVALKTDGSLWAWGENISGQLGDGATTYGITPRQVGTGYTAIALGQSHALALKSDGSLWAWGYNGWGQLGDNWTTQSSSLPKQIGTGYSAVAAGTYHSLALKSDGSLWAWGYNGTGQLGDGTTTSSGLPKRIGTGTGYTAIAAGTFHSLALKSDGSLWAWGHNGDGQLGDGTFTDRLAPKQIGTGYTAISAGAYHSLAIKSGGSLWAWGYNGDGQLGDGTYTYRLAPKQIGTGYTAVAAGYVHSVALKADGSLWVWGFKYGDFSYGITPTQVATGFSAIATDANHSLALKTDGTVWSGGFNNLGQLGDGTLAVRLLFVLAVNQTADGPLDLIPEIPNNIPPDKIPPFFVVASGSISNTGALVSTTTKFNADDVGKSGAVFVTAMVPSGSLVAVLSPLSALGTSTQSASRAYRTASSALTAANSFVLIQLTSSGWQPVANGQLIPYATGVLGDQLAAQTILDGTDTTNLKGSEFCVGYGTSAAEMTAAARMRAVATIPDPNATGAGTMSCSVQRVDMRSYIPAANAGAGYAGYLRVINTGSSATAVSVAVIDGATGAVGASGQLTASLPAGAAVTFTAQQVEAALGAPLPAGDRSRLRVSALATTIEVQSFMSNPAKVVTQISDALTADTGYAVRSYVPAANAVAGYTSFIRVINVGTTASPIQATLIDDTTGAAGASGQLIASLPVGAAVTFTAQQVETALGININASSRPRISIASSSVPSVPLEVQSFMANPDGTVTQIGGAQSGTAVAVRSFLPAANAASGYSGFIRVINTSTTATPISVSLLDEATGQAGASAQLMASLPAGAAKTFSAQQVETVLGLTLAASARPRIQVTANVPIEVQSFMSNPGGTVTQLSGAQSGSSADVRTYIPAANAAGGYASFIRVINTGTTATPVTVVVIDGATGAVGTAGQLTASLPAGAAVTYTAQQVETALGRAIPAADRSRIRVTASASTLEVQSFMSNPGGVITETVDFQ